MRVLIINPNSDQETADVLSKTAQSFLEDRGEFDVVSMSCLLYTSSALVDPPLTSVSTHVEEMARAALRLLGERASIGGREPIRTLPLKLVVPPTLTVRESTGPVRRL